MITSNALRSLEYFNIALDRESVETQDFTKICIIVFVLNGGWYVQTVATEYFSEPEVLNTELVKID